MLKDHLIEVAKGLEATIEENEKLKAVVFEMLMRGLVSLEGLRSITDKFGLKFTQEVASGAQEQANE